MSDGYVNEDYNPRTDILLLPCGHAAETEDDKIILDQCFVCDWQTPYRKQSHAVNDAAAERANAEAELIRWVRASRCGELGFDNDGMTELFERAIRASLRHSREEVLREQLKEIAQER